MIIGEVCCAANVLLKGVLWKFLLRSFTLVFNLPLVS